MAISPIGPSAMSSALSGIQRGFNGLDANAAKVASASAASGAEPRISLDRAMVGLKQNSHEVAASARVLSAQDDMLGTLLDVMA